ncbi:hypothetical protein CYLTODRAFT_415783 [Cylindrobasidium torrendii FP15055 ss-10]|uniref:Uncharacterized protein n=1 Tax=Cylindrobasidium torrendii FP15055 ss-10 TaxID=1314674 RepID=A0A0D7ASZ9_9AGAR|nr:hypothetical protein CYLTODRAFT_415783 [Cylindrobasidium torrendii FP15055 ss-10]
MPIWQLNFVFLALTADQRSVPLLSEASIAERHEGCGERIHERVIAKRVIDIGVSFGKLQMLEMWKGPGRRLCACNGADDIFGVEGVRGGEPQHDESWRQESKQLGVFVLVPGNT